MTSKRQSPRKKSRSGSSVLSQQKTKAILRELPSSLAFHFYEDVGRPTGHVAKSLFEFCDQLALSQSSAPKASLTFLMKRGDFAAWIRQAVGDAELADKIAKINPDAARLHKRLHQTVNRRLGQLKKTLMEYSIIPEDQYVIAS